MKRLVVLSTVVAALALVAVGAAWAAPGGGWDGDVYEETVTFENEGGTVVGTMAWPGHVRGKVPAVLLLHGFTGSRDELPVLDDEFNVIDTMYGRTARTFAESGIASLRIDFRGSGESIDQFTFEGTTFTGQISDALAAVEYLDQQRRIGDIGILGLSQGGLVGSVTAASNKRVESLALWSPVANPVDTYKLILGAGNVLDGLGQPATTITLPWGAVITLNQPFFLELYGVDPITAIDEFDEPLQVIVGARDDTVTPQPYYGQIYTTYHDGAEELVVLDGDHVFDVLAGVGPGVLDAAIAESLDWFQQTLHP